ncbi:MAG: hypothetical protein ACFE9L_08150 [Candidatus Hodarchaeota archaeon]
MDFKNLANPDERQINMPFWAKEIYLHHNLFSIFTQPFTPFVIVSAEHDDVYYYSHAFAQLSHIHPSTSLVSNKILFSLRRDLNSIPLGGCKLFYSSDTFPQPFSSAKEGWVDNLLHELRTGSLLMDLSSHLMRNMESIDQRVMYRFINAAQRQKISTIITTDLVQLLLYPPIVQPVSLTGVLRHSLKYLQQSSNTRFNLLSLTNKPETYHPDIFGSSNYPGNVFSTLLTWLHGVPITLEMEIINKFSVGITFNIPDDFLLSTIQGFSLIANYLSFFTSFFNSRSWMTHNSINLIFPRVFLE